MPVRSEALSVSAQKHAPVRKKSGKAKKMSSRAAAKKSVAARKRAAFKKRRQRQAVPAPFAQRPISSASPLSPSALRRKEQDVGTDTRISNIPKQPRAQAEEADTDDNLKDKLTSADEPREPIVKRNVESTEALEEEGGWMQKAFHAHSVGAPRMSTWHLIKMHLPFGSHEEDQGTSHIKSATPLPADPTEPLPTRTTESLDDLVFEKPERTVQRQAEQPAMNAPELPVSSKGSRGKEAPDAPPVLTRQELREERGRIVPGKGQRVEQEEGVPALKKPEPKKPESKKESAPAQEQPAEKTPPPKRKSKGMQQAGLAAFLASLNHIGLGKEKMLFIQNLATMLGAGLPLIDSLRTLQMETRSKSMRKVIKQITDSVENGYPLWRAMYEQYLFSPHAISLVRIGEEAGNLSENVEYLAIQDEKDHSLKQKVKMAMIYPIIVLVLMFIVVMGLGLFVLPNLVGVLFSLNVKLPLVTRLIIQFTNVFTAYGIILVPASIAGIVGVILLCKFTPLKVVAQWVMFRVPGIGRLAREATIARFGVILGGLLQAGVPIVEALQSLVEVTPILSYKKFYQHLLDHVAVGDSFARSFAMVKGSHKILPASVQQLVMTGEKSGSLAQIMLKVADIYDKKASDTAQKLPVILEPLLLLFIGGLVGTIAFAIIVPIYSVVGSVGR